MNSLAALSPQFIDPIPEVIRLGPPKLMPKHF